MIIMKTYVALLVLVGTFCILIDLCNSDTTEENESKTEEVEEEPLLSTLDMIVLGLAGKYNKVSSASEVMMNRFR